MSSLPYGSKISLVAVNNNNSTDVRHPLYHYLSAADETNRQWRSSSTPPS